MKQLADQIRAFRTATNGSVPVEYAGIAFFIGIAAVVAMSTVGISLRGVFESLIPGLS